MVTIDGTILATAMKVAGKQMPPIKSVSRMLDEAMVDYIVKRTPKGRAKPRA